MHDIALVKAPTLRLLHNDPISLDSAHKAINSDGVYHKKIVL